MRAIIIDDEKNSIDTLSIMIEKYTEITVVATYNSSVEAAKSLPNEQAEILFLDIEMPFINGFELLNMFPKMPWHVVFTTAYNEYAVKAFKVNAIDYLMKPILKEDLLSSIEKIKNKIVTGQPHLSHEVLKNKFKNQISKIAIPTLAGLEMILIEDISHLESKSNYCLINMNDNTKYMVSKTLKIFEHKLEPYHFIRVHNSFVVNPNQITRYVKGDGGYLIMDNGSNIPVSRSRKEALLMIINEL